MDYRERILNLVRSSPVQPTSLAKQLHTDSLMASAMLSEMSSKGLLKISSIKVGSSPLYYSPDHPEHLLNYLESLNDKDRQTVETLKEKKVLRDSSLSPLQKVSIRNVKDFARPLEVTLGEFKEIFWKWFLVSDNEAENVIKGLLEDGFEKRASKREDAKAIGSSKEKIKEPIEKKVKPEPKLKKPSVVKKVKKEAPVDSEVQPVSKPVFVDTGNPFLKKIRIFFEANNIVIHEVDTLKKSEFELVIEIPTALGGLFYFCKAKNNKRISNADLSNAYVRGQLKKLPVVFLSPGELTKPARNFMKDLKGLTVTRL